MPFRAGLMRTADPDTNMDVTLHIGPVSDGQVLQRVGDEVQGYTPLAYAGLAKVTVAVVAPSDPVAGNLWIDVS